MIWSLDVVFKNFIKSTLESFLKEDRSQLKQLKEKVDIMATTVKDLQAMIATLVENVAKESNLVSAATAAIQGLTTQQAELNKQLQEAIALNDSAAIQEVADALVAINDEVIAKTAMLATAIPANTPVAETTPETVTEPDSNPVPVVETPVETPVVEPPVDEPPAEPLGR